MMVSSFIVALLLFAFILPVAELLKQRQLSSSRLMRDREIADFSFNGSPTLRDRLQLRAIPNSRLIRAFHLNNSFTTSDIQVHREFLKKASQVIRLIQTDDWVKLGITTRTSLDSCLKHFSKGLPYVPLASFIRVISFGVMLHVLFGVDPSEINLDEARTATDAINRLWIQSKNDDIIPSLHDQTALNSALKKLLPKEYPCDSTANPLNLIMPAYETLWRVVLLTFVSISCQADDPKIIEELQMAVRNVPQCFCNRDELEMRALSIAKEGLRLYPPTKRIYRAASSKSPKSGKASVVAVDVEGWHRDYEVWGSTATIFDPRRFHAWSHEGAYERGPQEVSESNRHTCERKMCYFPFGIGRHACPAAAGFGDRIITLLVVELTRRLGTRQTGLTIYFDNFKPQKSPHSLLPCGRTDMENWVLEL